MTKNQLVRLVIKAAREKLKSPSYAFWAGCVANDTDVNDLAETVKRNRDKIK